MTSACWIRCSHSLIRVIPCLWLSVPVCCHPWVTPLCCWGWAVAPRLVCSAAFALQSAWLVSFGGWVYLGCGGAGPPQLRSCTFCRACVPCVWCVMPWALGLPAGCPCVSSAGSLDPNCGFGVILPWPSPFGSIAILVLPPPLNWGPHGGL